MPTKHALERPHEAQGSLDEVAARAVFEMTTGPGGRWLRFPVGRRLSASIGGVLVGSIFAGAGDWMIAREQMYLFGGTFAAVGGLIALATAWSMLNSLEVRAESKQIVTVPRLLGLPFRRSEMARSDSRHLEHKATFRTQSGRKHVIYFRIVAEGRAGQRLIVGTGFEGRSQASAALRILARGLRLPEPVDAADPASQANRLGAEVLT